MSKPVKRVVVTGGAGQIAYSLLFRIANGELLGKDQPLSLHLLEAPQGMDALKGIVMELQDCCFPCLRSIAIGSDPMEIFEGAEIVFLVGSKPRGPGMERKDLLQENGQIFVGQGQALNRVANRKELLVLVVGNPCNTNCLIALHHAPDIDSKRFHAMTRLDQNRAVFQLAHKAGVSTSDISNATIWGNHSSTQVPDFLNARIKGKKASEVIADKNWLEKEFFSRIQQRGAEIIKARGKSSAASAAQAALDAMRSLLVRSKENESFSSGIISRGNPYGVHEEIVFSFPLSCLGNFDYSIVPEFTWDAFLREKIALTERELLEERDLVAHLL